MPRRPISPEYGLGEFFSRVISELHADALCLWRADPDSVAQPVHSVPDGWIDAPFAIPGPEALPVFLACGDASLALLPAVTVRACDHTPGAVVRAIGSTRGFVCLWEAGHTPPPDACRRAQALLEQWAVLDDSRSRVRDLVMALPQGVITLPGQERPALVNEPAARFLGVPAGELTAPELETAFAALAARAEEPASADGLLSSALHSPETPCEFTLHLHDPAASLQFIVVPAPVGRAGDCTWLIDDVTREQASERRLRLVAERKQAHLAENLEVAIDAARLGPWSWYPDEGRLVWSDACKALFAIPASEEVDYARFMGALHPDDRERVQAGVERAISGGGDFDQEYRVVWPDGSEHWVNSLARVFYQPDGSLERFEGVAQDITARRESEQRIRDHVEALAQSKREIEALNEQLVLRAREAESAVLARTVFMRNVSHEFRTPLNHIVGGVELLLGGEVTPRQKTWLCRIRDAALGLNRMVDGVLDLVGLCSGSVTPESRAFSVGSIARGSMSLFSPQAAAKGLALTLRLDPRIPDLVNGDAPKIARLIEVYLGNALKFTEQGSILLEFSVQSQEADSLILRCTVTDTGPGIDADAQGRIFDAFEQGDGSLNRRHGGIGLGLSAVKRIASLLGGDAGVDSTPGAGSRFWFTTRLALPADAGKRLPTAVQHVVTLPPRAAVPLAPGVRTDALAMLGDLDGLLSADDMRAASALRANAEPLRRVLGKEPVEALSAAVDTFDFSGARNLVARFREGVSGA